jgi:hypothetical protein
MQMPANNRMFIKPCAGCRVIDPATGAPLPLNGAEVNYTPFWARRLRHQDVEFVTPDPLPPLPRKKEND